MIIRARTIVPIDGDPIDNGAIAVSGNVIADVGRFAEVRRRQSGEVFDLGENALLPGLINAHCHLDYTVLRGKIPAGGGSFAAWIQAINAEKAKLTGQDYIASINNGFAEALRFGTTTVANLTAFPELVPAVEAPIRTWWFGELIDVRNPDQAEKVVMQAVDTLKSTEHWGLAPHAPFTASAGLYSRCEEIARSENVRLTTHLAESREEMQMFRDAAGPAFDFLQSIGRPMTDCGSKTPLSLFEQRRTLGDRWIVAHLNELDPGDFALLEKAERFHIVHCPRSHTFFGHASFALRGLRALGFNICLGTDSLASNSDLSMFAEMRELLRKEPSVTPRQALEMATRNGALALGRAGRLGSLGVGARADLIAVPVAPSPDVFESVVAFDGFVPWLMSNGKVLTA
jgi:cytosine/adenosine deaminase-related metal-dependent hydrolase